MSLDLVAVQRDAALLDALSHRVAIDDLDEQVNQGTDLVIGLLAALVADVDEDLPVVSGAGAARVVPRHGGCASRRGTVSVLPRPVVPLPPAGRRHVARALAAAAVAAAMLSVSGVAAAVSGDPLTPYKRVIDVVRVGYHDVVPKGSKVAPKPPTVAPKKAKVVQVGAGVVPASGAASASTSWPANHVADHYGRHGHSGRHVWNRHGWGHHHQDGRHHDGFGGSDPRQGHYRSGQYGTGHEGGGASGDYGDGGRDTGEHRGQSRDPRR